MITCEESKNLLETEWYFRMKRKAAVPEFRCPPRIAKRNLPKDMKMEWIQMAHKYGIAYSLICNALEVCGLRKETVRKEAIFIVYTF